jgi:hypothetical protein
LLAVAIGDGGKGGLGFPGHIRVGVSVAVRVDDIVAAVTAEREGGGR